MRALRIILVFSLLISLPHKVVATDEYADFPVPKADFPAHIADVKRYLLDKQMGTRTAGDVQYNLPFELKANANVSYRGKFLLLHGLNDSPYVFSDVASELVKRGFDVRAVLLPGHGSTPRAQLNITAKRWMDAARQHLNLWRENESVPIYLGGFSMGAVIATTLALEEKNIAGLLLFSAAFRSSMNGMLRWASIYSRIRPWVFGGMIIEDNPTKYNSIPINGAAQYFKLTQNLKNSWKQHELAMPVLMVASVDDSVLDIDYLIKIFSNKFTSKNKKLILYSNLSNNKENAHVDYRASAYPALRILNQSHQSVIMSPDNPLFGKSGNVLVCNGNDWATFSGCLYSNESHWFGAQHTPSPDEVPVARTTYNPDFTGVFDAFDNVFEH